MYETKSYKFTVKWLSDTIDETFLYVIHAHNSCVVDLLSAYACFFTLFQRFIVSKYSTGSIAVQASFFLLFLSASGSKLWLILFTLHNDSGRFHFCTDVVNFMLHHISCHPTTTSLLPILHYGYSDLDTI